MRAFHLFLALTFYQCVYAQWFNNISTFTTQDGLSNNTVTSLQKDEAGFLWIGTHEGLNRYDGTEFLNVLSNTTNNLPSNNIIRICFINKTLLAVGTSTGLCLLNTVTLRGKKIELPYIEEFSTNGNYIEDILYKKPTGELWIATWHGIFVLNEEGKLLHKLMAAETDMNNGFFARNLLKDAKGNVFFFSQQKRGFYYPDFASQQLIPVEQRSPEYKLNEFIQNKYSLMSVQTLDHESICIFSKADKADISEYISYTNTQTGKRFTERVIINTDTEKRLSSAFPLNDSIFVINSYFGEPLLFNANRHEIGLAADHPLWFTSWPDGFGASFYKDDKDIWIGTSKGLLQSSLRTNYFKSNSQLIKKVEEYKALVGYQYGIYDNNKFLVACMGAGLFGVDTLHNTTQVLFDKKMATAEFTRKAVSTEVFSTGRSTWLFSMYGPVQINANHTISKIEGLNKDSAFDNYAAYPFKDNKGNVWTTLPNGISRYNITTNTFTNYISRYKGGVFPLLRAGIKTADAKGNIWMVRQDTLVKYTAATQTFSITLLKNNGVSLKPVTSLASDGNDILYMAVSGSLVMYHISTGNVDLFTKQTGIVSTAINDIVSDEQGNAWIATEGGLVYYNKQQMRFSSFTKADGLPEDEVIGLNFADTRRQILFLGFAKTYCLFEPRSFLLEKAVPANIITRVEVDGESLEPDAKQILSYKQNSISFRYTGINFNQGQQNNYACMLEGFDQDWKYPGQERKINYVNLPPNKYTFKVKTANHQGEWNEQPATFSFEITPPFWQRWWFRVLLGCIVISGIYYFIKRREANLQKENNIKLQMSELRMQALRAQMNPHFIFNSLNSIQNYILSNNTIDAAGYLSKFAKLMRRILDQSKHNFLPLAEVMETLKMYIEIEAFRFNHEFSYTFTIADDDELLDVSVPPMLLQPFAENAILHGLMPKKGTKMLAIDCHISGNAAVITIDDNGIGRIRHNEKAGHNSQGEKLTAGMLESLQQIRNSKASIEIIDKNENGVPSGTMVKLVLPLK